MKKKKETGKIGGSGTGLTNARRARSSSECQLEGRLLSSSESVLASLGSPHHRYITFSSHSESRRLPRHDRTLTVDLCLSAFLPACLCNYTIACSWASDTNCGTMTLTLERASPFQNYSFQIYVGFWILFDFRFRFVGQTKIQFYKNPKRSLGRYTYFRIIFVVERKVLDNSCRR